MSELMTSLISAAAIILAAAIGGFGAKNYADFCEAKARTANGSP
jgi:hypothetical protein